MNVGQLRKAIAELPDDMPVLIAGECGAGDEPNLYVIPARQAHIDSNVHPVVKAWFTSRGETLEPIGVGEQP
jgi:hypothetical protein